MARWLKRPPLAKDGRKKNGDKDDKDVDDGESDDDDDDSHVELRTPGLPVGLKNLGNTCYVNSFLQIWFHNVNFRQAAVQVKGTTGTRCPI